MIKIDTQFISKTDIEQKPKRESAQRLTFEQLAELLQRNVKKTTNKTYTQYTQEQVKTYLRSPAANLDNIREVSRFLERNSTLYKKILLYYAATPLFRYNITQLNDLSKELSPDKLLKKYYDVLKQMNGFNIKSDMFNAIYCTVRDGMYVSYAYTDGEKTFLMPLDVKYCRLYGKNMDGQWVVYFDATYFSGDREAFVTGDEEGNGTWDEVFVDGYNQYKTGGRDYQWFRLPPEKCFAMIANADIDFEVPLPLLVGIFPQLMQIEDLITLMASQDELNNYKLLVNKIPLVKNSEDVDDFSISIELANYFNELMQAKLPDLVASVNSPMDMEVVSFNKSNSTEDTDRINESIQSLFDNAGISQLVVAGGKSSNAVGLKHSLQNDMSNIWIYVNRIESWLNYYIKINISEGYKLTIHHVTWYNEDEYVSRTKNAATLGGDAMTYLTSMDETPYESVQKIHFDNLLGIKDLMRPLKTSYTDSANDGTNGRPVESNVDKLSPEGIKSREKTGSEAD